MERLSSLRSRSRQHSHQQQRLATNRSFDSAVSNGSTPRQQEQVQLRENSSLFDVQDKEEQSHPYSRRAAPLQQGRLASGMSGLGHVLPSIPEQYELTPRPSDLQRAQEEGKEEESEHPLTVAASGQRLPNFLSGLAEQSGASTPEPLSCTSSSRLQQLSLAASLQRYGMHQDTGQHGREQQIFQRMPSRGAFRGTPLARHSESRESVPEVREPFQSTTVSAETAAPIMQRFSAEDCERRLLTQQRTEELIQQRTPEIQLQQHHAAEQLRSLQRDRSLERKRHRRQTCPPNPVITSSGEQAISGSGSNDTSMAALSHPRQRQRGHAFSHRGQTETMAERSRQEAASLQRVFGTFSAGDRHRIARPSPSGPSVVSPAANGGIYPRAGAATPSLSSKRSTSTPRSLSSFLQRLKLPGGSAHAALFPFRPKLSSNAGSVIAATERDPSPFLSRTRGRTYAYGDDKGDPLKSEIPIPQARSSGTFAAVRSALSSGVGRLTRSKSSSVTVHAELLRSATLQCKSDLPAVLVAFTLPAVAAAFAPLCPTELPHALLPLCGVPLLLFALNFLHRNGITEILVLVKDDPEGQAVKAAAAAYSASLRKGGRSSHAAEDQVTRHQTLDPLKRYHHQQQDLLQQEEDSRLPRALQAQIFGNSTRQHHHRGSVLPTSLRIEVVELSRTVKTVGDALREVDSRADIRTDFLLMLVGTVAAADLRSAVAEHKQRAAAAADAALAVAASATAAFFPALGQRRTITALSSHTAIDAADSAAEPLRASLSVAASTVGGRCNVREQLLTQIFARVPPSSPHRLLEDDAAILVDASTHQIVAVKNLSSTNRSDEMFTSNGTRVIKDSSSEACKLFDDEGLGLSVGENAATISAGAQLQLHYDLVDVGLYLCSPKVLTLFSCCFDYSSVKEDLIPSAVQEANRNIRNAAVYAHILEAATAEVRDADRVLAPLVLIGHDTRIDDGACVRSSIIGSRCSIHSGVFVEDSILFDDVVLEEGVQVLQSLIAANCIIKRAAIIPRGCLLCHCVVLKEGVDVVPFTRLYSAELLHQLQEQQEGQHHRYKKQHEDPLYLLHHACKSVASRKNNAARIFHMRHEKHWVAAVSMGGTVAGCVALPLPRFCQRPSVGTEEVEGRKHENQNRYSIWKDFNGLYGDNRN